MRKKIEYVSEKLVKDEYRAFEKRILSVLEPTICKKYSQFSYHALLHPVTSAVWSSLSVSLYLKGSNFRTSLPSFRQQMCVIHDYMNLIRGIDAPPRFFGGANYVACYNGIATLLHEKEQFQRTQYISEEFWRELGSTHKENLSPECAELYLNFVEEMTLALTEAAVAMVSEQIQNIFPRESERYLRSLEGVYGVSIDQPIVAAGEESSQLKATKVKFSL